MQSSIVACLCHNPRAFSCGADAVDLVIRDVTPDDAEAIVGILNPIIAARTFTVIDGPLSVEDERAFIEAFPARGIFHVAVRTSDRRVLGFQNLEPLAAFTSAFDHVAGMATYVDLTSRRLGVARQLFAATFAAARRKGYEKIFTFVRADNGVALRTYLNQGFHVVGTARRQAKIDGRYVDEILIEKWLAETS
jgi:L-amino acid N-acyltransferase YncA